MPDASLPARSRVLASRAVHGGLALRWWLSGTRVMLTSIPKSGTHILRRLLHLISMPARAEVPWDIAPEDLRGALLGHRGEAVVGHVPASPEVVAAARSAGARVLFIARDPRDQVVSHLHHIRTHAEHALQPLFREHLGDDDEALLAVIRGHQFTDAAGIPSVDSLFRAFLPWRDVPGACNTTFERLIGPRGGGSAATQVHEVASLLRYLGAGAPYRASVDLISRRLYSTTSPTFHIGRIGAWRQHFKPCHAEAFKHVAGQLLIELGYERNLSW